MFQVEPEKLCLRETQDILRRAKAAPSAAAGATAAREFEVIDELLVSLKVNDLEELSATDQHEVGQI